MAERVDAFSGKPERIAPELSPERLAERTRRCSGCEEVKPLTEFYRVSPDGNYRGKCKDCLREIKRAQREPDYQPLCAKCGKDRPRRNPKYCTDCAPNERFEGRQRLKLKPCPCCGAEKSREEHVYGTSLCEVCRSVSTSVRQSLAKFGLTPQDYFDLIAYQEGVCAICKRAPKKTRLCVDHSHRKGYPLIRGALCQNCNAVLGLLKDNIEWLTEAIYYLTTPPATEILGEILATEEANRPGNWGHSPWGFSK